MKVCIYSENLKLIRKSGLGRSINHQLKAMKYAGIETTKNYLDDYDILLINTIGLKSKKIIKIAKKKQAKIIYYAHSTYEDFKNSFLFSNFVSFFYKKWITRLYLKADYVVVASEHNKKLIQKYSPKLSSIITISNGIDFAKYKNEKKKEENIKAFKKYFKIKKNEKVIVGGGLLIKRKGIYDFIEAAKKFPKYRFIWFGDTKWFLRQLKMNYKLLKAMQIKNLEFPGYKKGAIFNGALAGADVFFFPSYEEGEGIIILEAMANNQKCLIRNIDAYKGWASHLVNCYKFSNDEEMFDLLCKVVEKNAPLLKEEPLIAAEKKDLKIIGKHYSTFFKKILF